MKAAIFPSAFYPSLGGIEELVRQLSHELRRREQTPVLITNRWPRSLPAHEMHEELPLYRVAMRVPVGSLKAHVNYRLTGRTIRHQVERIVRQHGAELLHVQGVSANALYALHARRRLGLPLVVTLQGELTMDAAQIFQRHAFSAQLLRDVLAEADIITGVSRKTLEDAGAFCGQSFGDRGRVIFNGASLEDFREAQPYQHVRPYILAIGRLVPQKGFDVLLRAMAAADLPELDLLLAGEGPEREALEEIAQELGLSPRVHFTGRANRPQAAALFKGCEFFVIPSRADEGLPVVTAEAMAAGKAIVGTRSGGVPESVLDGETGLIVEREDVEGLTQAITQMANNEAMRRRMAAAGAARASVFSWPTITDQYQLAYRDAVRRHAASRRSRKLAG